VSSRWRPLTKGRDRDRLLVSLELDCETTMRFKGVSYAVYEVSDEITAHDELGVGLEHGCGDNGPWTDRVAVNRIHGLDPATAVVTAVAAHVLYVAQGVTIDELPGRIRESVVQ